MTAEIREDANDRHLRSCGCRQRELHQDYRPHPGADKVGWEWISLVDLENALTDHYQVYEAAVIAVPHEKWTEHLLAVVELPGATKLSAEELGEKLSRSFAKWWRPDAYGFVDELPRTPSEKFLTTALRTKFSARDWSG